MGSIVAFIENKASNPDFKIDDDKFFDFPVPIFANGKEGVAYIQDLIHEETANRHKIQVSLIFRDPTKGDFGIVMTKECVAPPGCELNWDSVHCATSFNSWPEELDVVES